MKNLLGRIAGADLLVGATVVMLALPAQAESKLKVVYPPPEHQTIAERIFFIGTASSQEPVFINGQKITNRSSSGHFAPSFPLELGENSFVIRTPDQELEFQVTRTSQQIELPQKLSFATESLKPDVDIARLPDEPICFEAIAPEDTQVMVQLGRKKILLTPQANTELPANSAVLTSEVIPQSQFNSGKYYGCTTLGAPRKYGQPIFTAQREDQTITQKAAGQVEIIAPDDFSSVEVTADAGVARTGPSTNYSRLTPLPQGTRARITGREGAWLRLDYGAWLKAEETEPLPGNNYPHSIIRGASAKQRESSTDIVFPLQQPVPVEIEQKESSITLTLHNTTAQTDTIRLDPDPLIKRLDWRQVNPQQIAYTFELHHPQQWGYDLNYQGSNLFFQLRHPPNVESRADGILEYDQGIVKGTRLEAPQPLQGISILLDPGHGGAELGARGPNGYPEKDVNLIVSQLTASELEKLGAKVYLTRTKDQDLSLKDRMAMIDELKPDLAISVHYNALPDSGDAENTKGISTFWYHTQAHAPATFLHNYLVEQLNREDAGVLWNNLALTRPHTAPSILLELGFMINPQEFEWITNPQEQEKLANTLASGIKEWFASLEVSSAER